MHTIETADPLEAQRCRRGQYRGLATALILNGSRYVGTVLAVKEVQSAGSTRWIVRLAPKTKKATLPRVRIPAPLRAWINVTSAALFAGDGAVQHRP